MNIKKYDITDVPHVEFMEKFRNCNQFKQSKWYIQYISYTVNSITIESDSCTDISTYDFYKMCEFIFKNVKNVNHVSVFGNNMTRKDFKMHPKLKKIKLDKQKLTELLKIMIDSRSDDLDDLYRFSRVLFDIDSNKTKYDENSLNVKIDGECLSISENEKHALSTTYIEWALKQLKERKNINAR